MWAHHYTKYFSPRNLPVKGYFLCDVENNIGGISLTLCEVNAVYEKARYFLIQGNKVNEKRNYFLITSIHVDDNICTTIW